MVENYKKGNFRNNYVKFKLIDVQFYEWTVV